MKAKHQRLVLAGLALVAVLGASGLALSALRDEAAFFYVPADVVSKDVPVDKPARLGGMVEQGSLQPQRDGISIRFVVTDGTASVPVTFTGVAPDLFREGSGVVAEGVFRPDGSFAASNLLAKHDERYMPPEVARAMAKAPAAGAPKQ